MMKTIGIFRAAMALWAFFSLGSVTVGAQPKDEGDPDLQYATTLLKPGTQAPDFTLPTADGGSFSLHSLRGQYVVLDFWASWCPDCRKDAPQVVAMYHKLKSKGVAFGGISFDVDAAQWKAAIEKYGMTYTHVSELKKMREADIAKAYGVKWIPSLYLIDPQGRVVMGTVMSEKLGKRLDAVVKKSRR